MMFCERQTFKIFLEKKAQNPSHKELGFDKYILDQIA